MFGSQSAFGTPAKPTGFGTPMGFGTPAATTTASGFSFGSSFGTTAPTGTAFGTPALGLQPMFGGSSSFGTPASSTPAFGSTFGAPTGTVAPTFGAPTSSTAPGGFGLSAFGTTTTSTAPSLFGPNTSKSIFNPATTAPSLFSTPASGSAAPMFGGQTNQPSLFGGAQTATTTVPSLFSSASTGNLFGSSFGTTTTTAPSLFGTSTTPAFGNFKAPTSTGSNLFGGFGGGSSGFGFGTQNQAGTLFGKPADQQQQQPPNQQQLVLASFYAINVFGDERDDILKKWNMLQASWGTGKGYYSSSQPPVEYNDTNPFYRFKAISYAIIPTMDNADGLVKMILNKKDTEVEAQKAQIISGFNGVLGNKPNLTVTVSHIKPLSETQCEIVVTVSEKGITGVSRKIHATDLAAFFNQPAQKQQLNAAGVTAIFALVTPSKAQIEEYLKEAPTGIDPQLWKAAQIDNPRPAKFLPSPMLGFNNLKKRMVCGEFETGLHKSFLEKVNGEILELKKKHAASIAQIAEQKQKFLQLQHRVLKILVKQESTRKLGLALQPEEEFLKGRLEMLHNYLNMPMQFRGKINDLKSTIKVAKTCQEMNKSEVYKIDPQAQEDIKQFLKMEQQGIAHLVSIINTSLKDLKIINDGLQSYVKTRTA